MIRGGKSPPPTIDDASPYSLYEPDIIELDLAKTSILFGVVGAFLAAISRLTFVDLDMFHEMALFREIISTHSFPKGDLFSYVPTLNPTVHHEWGFGALLYCATVVTGLGGTGLLLFKYLLCAGVCYGAYAFGRRYQTDLYVFGPISIIAIGLGWIGFTTIRAQLFSLFLLIMLFHFVERDRLGERRWIAIWLPLFLVWLNVHAGFLLGVGLLVFYTIELFTVEMLRNTSFPIAFRRVRHLLAVLVAMGFLLLANPWGFEYIPYLWRAVTLDRSSLITEWFPLWQKNISFMLLYLISLVVLVYCLLCAKCRNFSLLAFTCVTGWLALWHFRYLSIYSLAWICFVPAHVNRTRIGKSLLALGTKRNVVYVVYICIWLLIGITGSLYATWHKFWVLRVPTTAVEREREGIPVYPAGVVQFLKDRHFAGNIMVPFEAGSYVSWKLYPAVRVSMDSRFEAAYPISVTLENALFYQGKKNWEDMACNHSTDAILVPNWSPVRMDSMDGIGTEKNSMFRRVYADDGYSIYFRYPDSVKTGFVDRRGSSITNIFP